MSQHWSGDRRLWHRRKVSRCHFMLPALLLLWVDCWSRADTVLEVVNKQSNLRLFGAAMTATGLSSLLNDTSQRLTVFAPSDQTYAMAMRYNSLPCTMDYYVTGFCNSPAQYLASTDLKLSMSNSVVNSTFLSPSLTNSTVLRFLGSAVIQVSLLGSGQVWLGSAPVTLPDVNASNGVVHILGGILAASPGALNESSISVASSLGDFGPFNYSQRVQIASPASGSLPTDIPSLMQSYQKARVQVDLPQGGIINPMAISYNPAAMYRLLRAMPPAGYNDSEAINATSTLGAHATGLYAGAPMINIGSRGDDDGLVSAPVAANNASNRALGATNTSDPTGLAPSSGLGESGVIGGSSLLGSSDWQNQISVNVTRPASNDTLAFMTVLDLAALIKSQQVTAVELVEIFTARMQRYDYVLEAVVTYTTILAMQQARTVDALLREGTYLGPLHGIPYGLKDIIAVNGYPTTWGAPQFRNQYINENANVYIRLRDAGAVLVAKLATGEMAYDDVWWGGRVKNPWNIAEGSSGSSAGPAASTVAGTVPFAVGTETEGSLMSPAETCGTSAMRPSMGSIGRSYTMTLADSLDKLGPMCRSIADCAVIFDVLRGQDNLDPTSRDSALLDPVTVNVSQLTVGYLPGMDKQVPEVMEVLRGQGVTLKPFALNYTPSAEDTILKIMITEAAAHFDYWQRSGQDQQNVRQDYWPPLLRLARLIPAVEYIQAQRVRSLLAVQVMGSMRAAGIDAFIANSTTELAMSNLVGIPTVSMPVGYNLALAAAPNSNRRNPQTVGFFGWPNGEPEILALGMVWQNATKYHLQRPPIDNVEPDVLAQCYPYSRCTLSAASLAPAPGPSIIVSSNASGFADSG